MAEELLVSAHRLAEMIAAKECMVFDCRFDLRHRQQGRNSWLAAHIPGAVYAHLDENLAGKVTAMSGRHPLPNTRSFAAFLARSGWTPGEKVVAYDANSGAFAARLWWLMKYYDQRPVSLLDGGINAWMGAQLPLESGPVEPERQLLNRLYTHADMVLNVQAVIDGLAVDEILLLDARDGDRFEGRAETIDPVAGHVPGARSRPLELNLTGRKQFLAPEQLRASFRSLTKATDASKVVHMCGSGVTACHNQFAMELAGIEAGRLYAGSWSEWIRDPARPVATGKE